MVFLQPWEERDQTTQEVVNEVNKGLATIPGVRGNANQPSSLGRGRGQPINFVIAGGSYAELAKARDRIIAAAAENPGIQIGRAPSELQSLMRTSYAIFCLKKKKNIHKPRSNHKTIRETNPYIQYILKSKI